MVCSDVTCVVHTVYVRIVLVLVRTHQCVLKARAKGTYSWHEQTGRTDGTSLQYVPRRGTAQNTARTDISVSRCRAVRCSSWLSWTCPPALPVASAHHNRHSRYDTKLPNDVYCTFKCTVYVHNVLVHATASSTAQPVVIKLSYSYESSAEHYRYYQQTAAGGTSSSRDVTDLELARVLARRRVVAAPPRRRETPRLKAQPGTPCLEHSNTTQRTMFRASGHLLLVGIVR